MDPGHHGQVLGLFGLIRSGLRNELLDGLQSRVEQTQFMFHMGNSVSVLVQHKLDFCMCELQLGYLTRGQQLDHFTLNDDGTHIGPFSLHLGQFALMTMQGLFKGLGRFFTEFIEAFLILLDLMKLIRNLSEGRAKFPDLLFNVLEHGLFCITDMECIDGLEILSEFGQEGMDLLDALLTAGLVFYAIE